MSGLKKGMAMNFNTLGDALAWMYDNGTIDWLQRLDVNAWAISAPHGMHATSKLLSTIYDKTVWPTGTGASITRGRLKTEFLVLRDMVAKVEQARDCCIELDVEPTWGAGNMARKIIATLGKGQEGEGLKETFLQGAGIGYREVKPGKYAYGCCFDVSGCYYHLLKRAPSLHVEIHRNRVVWQKRRTGQWERWEQVINEVGGAKLLRNTLWGAMSGGSGDASKYRYHKGERLLWKPGKGNFLPLGLLVARTSWELCREASIEVDSIHSHTDSVICPDNRVPKTWSNWGLETKIEAQGRACVQASGAYRVGKKRTQLYEPNAPVRIHIDRAPAPPWLAYPQWLGA